MYELLKTLEILFAFDSLFISQICFAQRAGTCQSGPGAIRYFSKPVVGRNRERVVCLNVDPGRQRCTEMACSDVDAPFRVGETRDPDGVDKVSGQGCGRDILEASRFLVGFKSWGDDQKVLYRNRESDSAKSPSLPIQSVPTIAILLGVGAANAGAPYKSELFPIMKSFVPTR